MIQPPRRGRRGRLVARWLLAVSLGAASVLQPGLNHAEPLAVPPAPAWREAALRQEGESLPPGRPLASEPARDLLSLSDLEHQALANHPAVRRAAALAGAAHGHWVQVGLPPNPTVGYEGQQLGSGGRAEQHGVAFGQEFVHGEKLRLNRAVAGQDVARARQELAIQQQRVLNEVRIAFHLALLAQRQIDLADELLRISRQAQGKVEQLLAAQEASRVESLQAELEVEAARLELQTARHRHESAWRELAAAVGDPALPPQPLAGDAFAPPREFDYASSLQRLMAASPEVAAAATAIDRARLALARAAVEPTPNVSVQGLVNWRDNGIGGGPDGGLALSLPLPLFDRNQGAILKAQHEVTAAEQALEQLELDLRQRLARTFERYANARFQADRYRMRVLPAAAESLALARQRYEAGETSYLELLTVQQTFARMNLQHLAALQALRVAEVELDGQLLRASP